MSLLPLAMWATSSVLVLVPKAVPMMCTGCAPQELASINGTLRDESYYKAIELQAVRGRFPTPPSAQLRLRLLSPSAQRHPDYLRRLIDCARHLLRSLWN